MNDEELEAFNQAMLSEAREQVEGTFLKAVTKGISNPVLFLVDPLAEDGKVLLMNAGGPEDVIQEHCQEAKRRGIKPYMVLPIPLDKIGQLVTTKFAQAIEKSHHPECFTIVVVSQAGTSTCALPRPD